MKKRIDKRLKIIPQAGGVVNLRRQNKKKAFSPPPHKCNDGFCHKDFNLNGIKG
jgi:hypothetical protein